MAAPLLVHSETPAHVSGQRRIGHPLGHHGLDIAAHRTILGLVHARRSVPWRPASRRVGTAMQLTPSASPGRTGLVRRAFSTGTLPRNSASTGRWVTNEKPGGASVKSDSVSDSRKSRGSARPAWRRNRRARAWADARLRRARAVRTAKKVPRCRGSVRARPGLGCPRKFARSGRGRRHASRSRGSPGKRLVPQELRMGIEADHLPRLAQAHQVQRVEAVLVDHPRHLAEPAAVPAPLLPLQAQRLPVSRGCGPPR